MRTLLKPAPLLIWVGAVAAQTPAPHPPLVLRDISPPPFAGPARSPAAVIERLVSFDVNADGRTSRDELPERMQALVARGDTNADAALDSDEIRALVNAASLDRARLAFRPQRSEGLPGVIDDLKLPSGKRERALVIVSDLKPSPALNDTASLALFREMKDLLDAEEYENFVAAATRLSRTTDVRFVSVSGSVGVLKRLQ